MASLTFLLVFFHITSILSTVIPDEAQPVPCNSCCQGPAGIPGVPGSNGLHGRDGLRGEIGIKGDVGEPGGIGDKGDRGFQGLPGKVGPKGSHGHSGTDGQPGSDGRPGPPGPKGSHGGLSEVQKSAFSVFKTSTQTGNDGDVLTFGDEEINIGSDFNMATDKFTCEIPGTYVFMFTIFANRESDDPAIELVKDDLSIARAALVTAGEDTSSYNRQSSTGTVIVQLSAGNKVWLKFDARSGEKVFGSSNKHTSFSGFLLYPE